MGFRILGVFGVLECRGLGFSVLVFRALVFQGLEFSTRTLAPAGTTR